MNRNIIKKILKEGLMLPYKKTRFEQFAINDEPQVIYITHSFITAKIPYNIAEQLFKDKIITWNNDIDGWLTHEKNRWILYYINEHKKLPPKYIEFPHYYITPGHDVLVNDSEQGEYQARVVGFHDEFVTIVDGNDDYYDYEVEELTYDEV